MENIQCLVVSFKQTEDEPEYIYFVSDREIKQGDYYLDATSTPFTRVQYMRKQKLHDRVRRLEATDNPRYLLATLDIQVVPKSFREAYFESGRNTKQAPLRVK